MRSPFPGMDPWLEHPATWPGVHHRLITYAGDRLQNAVGDRYRVAIGERILFEPPSRTIYPAVSVIQERSPGAGSVEGLEPDRPVIVLLDAVEYREGFLELRDPRSGNRVVTVIEFLSPANKHPGEGHAQYDRKQAELIETGVNFVEIDLLRGGRRTVALSDERSADADYLVVVTRGAAPSRREVFPLSVRDRLPRVGIPVVPPDPDAVLGGRLLSCVTHHRRRACRVMVTPHESRRLP